MQLLSTVVAGVELIETVTDDPQAAKDPGKPVAPEKFRLACAFVPAASAVGAVNVTTIGEALG